MKEERRRDDGDKLPRDASSSRAGEKNGDERGRGEKDRQRERVDERDDVKKVKLSAEGRRGGEYRDEPRSRDIDARRERDDARREKEEAAMQRKLERERLERDMRASSAASSGSDKQLNSTDPSPRRVEERGQSRDNESSTKNQSLSSLVLLSRKKIAKSLFSFYF